MKAIHKTYYQFYKKFVKLIVKVNVYEVIVSKIWAD